MGAAVPGACGRTIQALGFLSKLLPEAYNAALAELKQIQLRPRRAKVRGAERGPFVSEAVLTARRRE